MRRWCVCCFAAVISLWGATVGAQQREAAATPPMLVDPSPRFQITAAGGVGANTTRDVPGVAIGVFGMLRLSRTPGSVVGLSFLLSRSFSAARSEAYMAGFHLGDTVYYQLLVGLASGSESAAVVPTTDYEAHSVFGLAVGSALGLHLHLAGSFGMNLEAFLAQSMFAHTPTAGVLLGPTFEKHDPGANAGNSTPPAEPHERGSHVELSILYSKYFPLSGDTPLDKTTWGPRVAFVKVFGEGWAASVGARLGGGYGGFDLSAHYRFDHFTGRAVAPYLDAGPLFLFGPSATGNELFIPAVDILVGGGAGIEFRLTRWSAISPSFRWYHPLATRRSYTGPMDLTLVWSLDI